MLSRAIEKDTMKRDDEFVKHSTSAVDTIACLSAISAFNVVAFVALAYTEIRFNSDLSHKLCFIVFNFVLQRFFVNFYF